MFGKWVYLPNDRAYMGVIDPVAGDVYVYKPPYNGSSPTSDLNSLSLSSSSTNGCSNVTGTVSLTGPAPAGGFEVRLSDNLASAVVPPSVRVAAGAVTAAFSIQVTPVSASEAGSVIATGTSKTSTQSLSIRPIALSAITLSPTAVVGGSPVTGTATLECAAAPGPVSVSLSSSNSTLARPVAATITVPQSLVAASFDVTTYAVVNDSPVTISGTAGGTTKSAPLTLKPANYLPAVTLTAPANGASFALGAPIALAATASDADGTVARVEFFAGATLLVADTSAPFGYNWATAPARRAHAHRRRRR